MRRNRYPRLRKGKKQLESDRRMRMNMPSQGVRTWKRESTSTVVWVTLERVRLARSQADLSLLRALGSSEMSSLVLRSNSFLKCSKRALSKSSPPRWVSPAVALTANTPPVMARRETSKVPPPRSKIKTSFSFFDFSVASPSP